MNNNKTVKWFAKSEVGDFVKCTYCDEPLMVINVGEDICPLCEEEGSLMWIEDKNGIEIQKVTEEDVKKMGHDIKYMDEQYKGDCKMYNKDKLKSMLTIENNMVYGELKIDTDKTRVYINDKNTVTVEEYINGFENNYWMITNSY